MINYGCHSSIFSTEIQLSALEVAFVLSIQFSFGTYIDDVILTVRSSQSLFEEFTIHHLCSISWHHVCPVFIPFSLYQSYFGCYNSDRD